MQTHHDRVERLKLHGEQIVLQFRSTDSIKDDLHSFTQRWQKAFNAIGKDADTWAQRSVVARDR